MKEQQINGTFSLGGKTFRIDSIPEDYKTLFNDIGIVTDKLHEVDIQRNIVKVAQDALLKQFSKCKDKLIVVGEKQPEKPNIAPGTPPENA